MNEKLMTTFKQKKTRYTVCMLCKKRNENVYQYPYWSVLNSPDALPFSEHLQISVDIKLFVHDRVTSTF